MSTTAFVLSGGGSLGAVQVGMLQALAERGIAPDLVVGSSVGALNGAWVAGHPGTPVAELAAVWRAIRRADVFPLSVRGTLGLLGRRNHLVSPAGLEKLVRSNLPHHRLEDFPVPLHVVATEVATGMEVVLARGDAVQAVLASSAIPGVFPPVDVEGHLLMDGGVVDNTPVSHAVRLGADRVYVLPTGYACALGEPPSSALGMALHAVTLTIEQRLINDVERYEAQTEMHVIPPLCPLAVPPADFSHTASLIHRAHAFAADWLDQPHPRRGQARLLGWHHHGPATGAAAS
jgi:NTE family protein